MVKSASPLPKRLFMLWFQGRENAAAIVKHNFQRWEALNPDFEITILDERAARRYLDHLPIDVDRLYPAAKADIVRLRLLAEYGGVWADASVYPIKPLSAWLPGMMGGSDFLAFSRPEAVRPLANWFLAANEDSLIMSRWHQLATRYWQVDRTWGRKNDVKDLLGEMRPFDIANPAPVPYFWPHHLFAILLETDPAVAAAWKRAQFPSAMPLHALQRHYSRLNRSRLRRLENRARQICSGYRNDAFLECVKDTPLQKLNWKLRYPMKEFEIAESLL